MDNKHVRHLCEEGALLNINFFVAAIARIVIDDLPITDCRQTFVDV
jgi:hypothetical protein